MQFLHPRLNKMPQKCGHPLPKANAVPDKFNMRDACRPADGCVQSSRQFFQGQGRRGSCFSPVFTGVAMNAENRKFLTRLRTGIAMRILVVDDDFNTREILAGALELFGAEVRNAASVADAREVLAGWLPDVIISDLAMPVEDGYDLIRFVRAMPRAQGGLLPALALTGYPDEEQHRLALDFGYDEVLIKPTGLEGLLAAIRRVAMEGQPES
jgi:CheY-like chemotaxis protein